MPPPGSTSRPFSPTDPDDRPMTITARPDATEADPRIRDGRLVPEVLRGDFPIPGPPNARGRPLVSLDSASASQKPLAVIDAVDTYYREYNANVHRGIYEIGERATAAYEAARASVGRVLNGPDSHAI